MASKKKVIKEERPPDAPLGVSDGPSSAGWHKVEAGFRCYKEYQYAQVRGITNPQAETPDPLAIGLLMHVGKGRWFSKQFDSSEEMLEKIRNEMLDYAMRAKLPMSVRRSRLRSGTSPSTSTTGECGLVLGCSRLSTCLATAP